MKILVLIEEYYPDFNQNSYCFEKIVEKLKSYNNITIVTSKLKSKYYKKNNGIRVIRLPNYYLSLYKKYYYEYAKSSLWLVFKIINSAFINIFWADINIIWYLQNRKYILNYIKNNNIGVVICSSGSFSVQQFGMYLKTKNKNIQFIPYIMDDPLPDINKIFKRRHNIIINKRKATYNLFVKADRIFLTSHIYNIYKEKYKIFNSKMIEVDLPLLNPKIQKTSNKNYRFIYTGTFYSDIRNPEKMLNIFQKLYDSYEFELYLLYNGDCNDIIEEYSKNNSWIKDIGYVQKEKCQQYLNKSDILINLGNNNNSQTPSKIFDYINSGKKIINFYNTENDSSLDYLKRYANSLNIDMNIDENIIIKLLINFLNSKTIEIGESDLNILFNKNLPEYSLNKIIGVISR